MTDWKIALTRRLLCGALSKRCPERIPRSGERGAQVNCFSASIDALNGEPHLFVNRLDGDTLYCLKWDGERYQIPVSIDISEIPPDRLVVTHFYGLSEIVFVGFRSFIIGRAIKFPYIKIWLRRSLTSVDQYFFNKRKIVTKQRVDLLRAIWEMHLEGTDKVSVISLMTRLYSMRRLSHPQSNAAMSKTSSVLKLLVGAGDLTKDGTTYRLTGVGLRTISEYEEQERKHTENIKVQRLIMWLTVAIVLLTAVQAGLLKLPTLIDLTGRP